MVRRQVFSIASVAMALHIAPIAAAEPTERLITYVSRADDGDYKKKRRYTGLILRQQHPLLGAVNAAIREVKIIGRARGIKFKLDQVTVGAGQDAVEAVRAHQANQDGNIYILDLPVADTASVASVLANQNAITINPRHTATLLRRSGCQRNLFHTIPSRDMLLDALAQFLRQRNWTKVLALVGEHPDDAMNDRAFERSARKFGLSIIARRTFTLSNDPRQRDKNNVALLTQGSYDAVFISDELGEFGRYIPFQTALPRPVVGAHGLRAGAWHWTWERHGAPQLNQRFVRRNRRQMNGRDWAAWAAVRSVVEAAVRTRKTDVTAISNFLRGSAFNLDAYKGTPASFRRWNNQLRQPILLHTHDAVIDRAPIEGFLHKTSKLDTLGDDEPHSRCKIGVE